MQLLRWVELEEDAPQEGFPWRLAAVRTLRRLEFTTPVTFLVGENGTGKSTLLEGIAIATGLNAEGGTRNLRYTARPTESPLHDHLRLAWSGRPRRAFFLRAETFFNMASAYEDVLADAGSDPLANLHYRSHGEQFLDAIRSRFGAGGLFLMDEPESALSFISQLALIRFMHEYAAQGSQFIVATHSPVLIALPGATIQLLDTVGTRPVELEEAPQYRDVRAFLNSPGLYLHHLLAD